MKFIAFRIFSCFLCFLKVFLCSLMLYVVMKCFFRVFQFIPIFFSPTLQFICRLSTVLWVIFSLCYCHELYEFADSLHNKHQDTVKNCQWENSDTLGWLRSGYFSMLDGLMMCFLFVWGFKWFCGKLLGGF